ncbi:Fructose-2,6-bisphosphatase [Malassezia cuniculi]|uniref:fructose-2,6-bisphosphate 2-phosphatase n=1 Tax=Malassezia cuniculi TaxID=948313 RepID=A0AAF0EXJ3_9BASI|nr:Fructose-2,6-bisphosphatase [Malassezia cuniculi]
MAERDPSQQKHDAAAEDAASSPPKMIDGASFARPMPPPDPMERLKFEEHAASSMNRPAADGLVALLRDHPELVSTSLAKEAERQLHLENVPRNTRIRMQSYTTPVDENDDGPSMLFPSSTPPETNGGRPRRRSSSSSALVGSGIAMMPMDKDSEQPPMWYPTGANTPSISGTFTPNLGETGAPPDYSGEKVVVVMVGLPARGKSYLANKLMRYLQWREYNVKVFNVGQLRRAVAHQRGLSTGRRPVQTAAFFDPHDADYRKQRDQLAARCLDELVAWLKKGGNVGIHDATNTTRARRNLIVERLRREPGIRVLFLETIAEDPDVINRNVDVKVRSGDPDYRGMSREQAREDFLRRIKHYEDVYEPLDVDGSERHLSYCKLVDRGRSTTLNLVNSFLESQIAFYLMNLHASPRNIFLSRHGESQYNVQGKIGGDSELSEHGWAYARALPGLVRDNIGDAKLTVWHSSMRRTGQTASMLDYPKLVWKALDELDAGVCDGMTYEEIEQFYPEDYANRDEDKFNYRYRGGESYRDVVVRLEPVIMELERQDNILIIGHQAILRCLYAYFHGLDQSELPYIKIPLHTVIKLTPKAYGCDEERYKLPIEAVDTHRPKPGRSSHSEKEPESELLRAMTSAPPSQQRVDEKEE